MENKTLEPTPVGRFSFILASWSGVAQLGRYAAMLGSQ